MKEHSNVLGNKYKQKDKTRFLKRQQLKILRDGLFLAINSRKVKWKGYWWQPQRRTCTKHDRQGGKHFVHLWVNNSTYSPASQRDAKQLIARISLQQFALWTICICNSYFHKNSRLAWSHSGFSNGKINDRYRRDKPGGNELLPMTLSVLTHITTNTLPQVCHTTELWSCTFLCCYMYIAFFGFMCIS